MINQISDRNQSILSLRVDCDRQQKGIGRRFDSTTQSKNYLFGIELIWLSLAIVITLTSRVSIVRFLRGLA